MPANGNPRSIHTSRPGRATWLAALLLLAVGRAPAQAAESSRFIEARGVSIHYLESRPAIAGEPWLLLIHGFGASTESWHDVVPLLASGVRVVRIDLRGFGRSAMPPDTLYAPTEQAEIVAELLPRLGSGPVFIAGHSYGGAVAFITYLRLRARGRAAEVAGLILMDAATYPQEFPFFIQVLRDPFTRFLAERFTSARWRTRFTLERIVVRRDRIDDARVERYARALRREGAEHAIAQVARQVAPPNAAALADSLRTFDVPTLIVWGERDPVIPVANARRLQADIRGAELVVIRGSGHVPQEEYPEPTAAAMLRFVERVRSTTARPAPTARGSRASVPPPSPRPSSTP